MKTPDVLIPALRQYQHNDKSGFVFGYDMEVANEVVDQLENSNFEMEGVLNQINKMIRFGYVNLGDDLNYQIFAMFGRDKTK